MNRHAHHILLFVALLSLLASPAFGAPFRSIGIRLLIPFGGLPVVVGLEATSDLGFLIGSLAFFLSLEGDVLLLGNLDVPLDPADLGTCARVTLGAYDFDPLPALPALAIGGGVAYYADPLGWLGVSLAGEFIYPIAFPLPMFSIGGGWMIP